MQNNIKLFLNSTLGLFPASFSTKLRTIRYNWILKNVQKNYRIVLEKIRKKDKIKVAFFLIHDSIWKYEGVYKLMEKDERFEPVVFVCPYIAYGEENMLKDMNQAYKSFKDKGYNVVKTLNEKTGAWLNVKKDINPDIVFFTNPHKLTKDEYYIDNYLDTLTCYVPYAYVVIHSIQMHYNQHFHKHLWKHFVETTYHQNFALQYLPKFVDNVTVTGYPSLDKALTEDYIPKCVWKQVEGSQIIKKIIWAPHHTIAGQGSALDYSSFMELAEFIINYLKLNSQIQMAFKPHPLLKVKLYNDEMWGKDKTDKYFNSWNEILNGQLEEGDYVDLFFSSDALILDSASFMVEYLYTKKPSLFTAYDTSIRSRFNDFGQIVYDHLYHAQGKNEIENFIDAVVKEEKDEMFEKRMQLLENILLPKNKQSASMNIYLQIKKELNWNYEPK